MTKMMTIQQVARMAGVGERTISAYIAREQMPTPIVCPCCGRTPVWAKQEIDEWLRARKLSTRVVHA